MSKKVLQSNNYSRFNQHKHNRPLNRTHINKLKKSMEKHGWLNSEPMMVVPNGNNKYDIIRGHHRFVAARELKILVKYVTVPEEEVPKIFEMESTVKKWSLNDFLKHFADQGYDRYIDLEKYISATEFPVSAVLNIVCGSHSTMLQRFKEGKLVFTKEGLARAKEIAVISQKTKELEGSFYRTSSYLRALLNMMFVTEFDSYFFCKKLKMNKELLEPKVNIEEYMKMIDEIYNRRTRKRIPLLFLAKEAARGRTLKNFRK